MTELGHLLSLEYGAALPAERRAGYGFPVFGSNGEVGRHDRPLVEGPGIIVGRKGSVGKICWSDQSFWPIDTTYWVKCATNDRRWLFWLLSRLPLSELDSSTGVPGLNRNDVYELNVFEPPSAEKARLATILDSLDTTIRQTEAIIEKLQQVKQGLRHDLLTRGIEANGELRPPQNEAPHLYKKSVLGWIPREWDILQLRDVGEAITGATPPSTDPLAWGAGWPFITPSDVLENQPIGSAERNVSKRGVGYVRILPPGVTVVVCIGSTIGKVGITSVEACSNQQINSLVPRDNMAPEFVHLAVLMHIGQLRAMAGLQAVPIVNKTSFESMWIPVPPHSEQLEIAARVDSTAGRIRQEAKLAIKLNKTRSGLMDDLLTGRVRALTLLA